MQPISSPARALSPSGRWPAPRASAILRSMSKRAAWGLAAVALAVATVVATLSDETALEAETTAYLTDRLWIERMPDGDTDMVGKLAVVRSIDHGRFGVTELGSVWRHHSEVFRWRLEGDVLHTAWPQDGEYLGLRVRTRECEGQAPEPFELCLDLIGEGEVLTLYSRHDWVVRPRGEGDELIDEPIVRGWVQSMPPSPVADSSIPWGRRAPHRAGLWPR